MVSKVTIYVILSIVVIVAAIASYMIYNYPQNPLTSQSTHPKRYSIIIGSGTIGGVYYYYGAAIAGIISNYTSISATSIETGGSFYNLQLIRDKTDLEKGVIYCGTSMLDAAYLAYAGKHEWFSGKPAPIAILWAMYPNILHIVTTTDTGIKTIDDLRGKRVSTLNPGSVTEYVALQLLKVVGIDPSKDLAKWERLGAAESANALRDGAIDAYFWVGGVPTGSVLELAKSLAARGKQIYLVPVNESIIRAYASQYAPGVVVSGVIPKEVYGTAADTPTLVIWNVFVCHRDAPAEVIYSITKAVFEHLDFLHKSVAAARDTNLDNALKFYGGMIPYHEGALKYYKEKGLLKG
ncbi:MAG: TAXI family TRAP transporter solute-binding subunit [Sulfolobales archaeon]